MTAENPDSGVVKSIFRKQFDAMAPADKARWIQSGGQVADPAPAAHDEGSRLRDPNILSRRQFDALPPMERVSHVRAGRRVIDLP